MRISLIRIIALQIKHLHAAFTVKSRIQVLFTMFGLLLVTWGISATAYAQDRSKAMAQFVPARMEAGKKYSVMVQFKNTGDAAWSNAQQYRLGVQNPRNNRRWGVKRVKLARTVSPGHTATIKFSVTAPARAGVYNFQWQMHHAIRGWFGRKTPNVRVTVEDASIINNADFVMQEFPGLITVGPPFAVLNTGQNFVVSIIIKNSGKSPWSYGSFKLGSQKPKNNLTWMIDTVELDPEDEIQPGQFKTFTFNAAAPTEPGIYDFQWQMKQGDGGWFGAPTPMVKITVH